MAEGVLLGREVEEGQAEIDQMGETGSQGGRRMEVISGEAGGKGTGIGKETAIETETARGTGTAKETETGTGTETDEGGKKGEAARITSGGAGEATLPRGIGIEGGVRRENGGEGTEGVETGGAKPLEKKGTDRGERNGERGPRGGTETIAWQN